MVYIISYLPTIELQRPHLKDKQSQYHKSRDKRYNIIDDSVALNTFTNCTTLYLTHYYVIRLKAITTVTTP